MRIVVERNKQKQSLVRFPIPSHFVLIVLTIFQLSFFSTTLRAQADVKPEDIVFSSGKAKLGPSETKLAKEAKPAPNPKAKPAVKAAPTDVPNEAKQKSKPAGSGPVEFNIREALARGLRDNKNMQSIRERIRLAKADVDRVSGEFGPRIQLKAGVGPMTRATGNAVQSAVDTSDWGAIVLGSVEVTQPLWTFGRKDDYERAAQYGVHAKEAEVASEQDKLRYQIKEAYYGYLYAKTLKDFIDSGKSDLEEALKKKPKMSKEDRFKLEIFKATLDAKAAEVDRALIYAKRGLSLLVGVPLTQGVATEEEWLDWEERELQPLLHYQQIAHKENTDLKQLSAGIIAKNSLARAEDKGAYPVVAMLLKLDYAYTDMRDEQQSVFANDPFNDESLVVGVGVSWDFQWGLASAKASKHRAEAVELELKQDFSRDGVDFLVEKAWLELREAETKLEAAERASTAGKKWLSGILIGMSAGFGDIEKLVEAYQARAVTLKDYFEAVYRHHLAWAKLSQVVGQEVDPLILAD